MTAPHSPVDERAVSPGEDTFAERVFFRLICIGVRKYSAEPSSRPSAALLMLTNAIRLAIRHMGRQAAAEAILHVLEDRP